jgi:hypothetical protein
MSKKLNTEITCPHCNSTIAAVLWESVNVTVDKNLKEKVLNKTINTMICGKCSENIIVIKDLLYHDMDSNYMIYLIPRHFTEEHKKAIKMMQTLMKHKTIHLVRTMDRLVEKIVILDNNLIDYFVEAAKIALVEQIKNYIEEPDILGYINENLFMFDVKKNERSQIEKIRFLLRTEDQKALIAELPYSNYKAGISHFKPMFDSLINKEHESYYFIDTLFVMSIIDDHWDS